MMRRAGFPVLLALALAIVAGTAAAKSDMVDELNFYNTDLHLVLQALGQKTGFTFVEDVPVGGKVTIHISKKTPLPEVLDQLLRGLNLSWRLERDVYHIGPKTQGPGRAPAKGLISRTYSLENMAADEAAESIRPMLSEYGKVTTDRGLNAITVLDIGEIQESVKTLLTGMDVEGRRTPQVNIQIKVLQIDRTNTSDTSASMSWNKYSAFETLGSNYNDTLNNVPGWGSQWDGWRATDKWAEWQALDERRAYYPNGLTFKTGHFGIDDVMLRFFAAVGTDRLSVLSEPDVTVLDGQEARILLGERLPLLTSGGGFQYQETGIILKVTPRTAAEGVIGLTLNPQITERSLETFGSVNVLNTREVSTQVEVVSGGTIRIGGLLITEQVLTEAKIPVLGDIPLLGILFKRSSIQNMRKELVVLVSPRIVESIPPRCASTAGISALQASLVAGTPDVALDWSEDVPYDNVGIAHYNVYRDTRPILATAGLSPLSREVAGDATTWTDRTFKRRGVTYFYAIIAVDGAGNEQAVSNSPSVMVPRR